MNGGTYNTLFVEALGNKFGVFKWLSLDIVSISEVIKPIKDYKNIFTSSSSDGKCEGLMGRGESWVDTASEIEMWVASIFPGTQGDKFEVLTKLHVFMNSSEM